MRTIVHISDIHFGRVNNAVVQPLVDAVTRIKPSVVVVSGDLTQRARRSEFRAARRFLDSLPTPQIVVPGNHDVPLLNVAARFLTPLAAYRRYVSIDLEPYFADDEVAVLGLNTARSLTWKNGRISREQLEAVRRRFAAVPPGVVKILVTHHPLDLPERFGPEHLVGRAEQAMPVLAECGVDVLLAGHYHLSHTGDTTTRYPIVGYSALVVHAGTTTSTRVRFEEPNSFNLLHLAAGEIIVDRFTWRSATNEFLLLMQERFERTGRGWARRAVGKDFA
jgi:3',5'-cyclic AMP phosphodiesterase CpdA